MAAQPAPHAILETSLGEIEIEFFDDKAPLHVKNFLDLAPHWAIFPGLLIFLAVLSINYIGDGLRDALDPRKTQ